MGDAGSEDDSDEAALHRDYELVIKSLCALFLLFTPDVPAARALTAENLASARTSLADAVLDRGTYGAIFRVLDYAYLCGRVVPGGSDDFPADSERQVETKKLWQRFRTDNCEVLRKEAHDVRNPRNTVCRGSQSSRAAVLKQFYLIESQQRRAAARMESSAKGQKKVFNARYDSVFEEAASAPE
jgi:hypothetical protein